MAYMNLLRIGPRRRLRRHQTGCLGNHHHQHPFRHRRRRQNTFRYQVLRRYRFTVAEVFLVTGIQGIFFEQLGAVFLMMVRSLATNPLLSLVFGLYVCAVHGSAAGLAVHRVALDAIEAGGGSLRRCVAEVF